MESDAMAVLCSCQFFSFSTQEKKGSKWEIIIINKWMHKVVLKCIMVFYLIKKYISPLLPTFYDKGNHPSQNKCHFVICELRKKGTKGKKVSLNSPSRCSVEISVFINNHKNQIAETSHNSHPLNTFPVCGLAWAESCLCVFMHTITKECQKNESTNGVGSVTHIKVYSNCHKEAIKNFKRYRRRNVFWGEFAISDEWDRGWL